MARGIIDIKKDIAILDLGTCTFCASVIKENKGKNDDSLSLNPGNDLRILGAGYQLAKGIKRGSLTNLEYLEDSILNAVSVAESEAQKSIKSIYIALPSWMFESQIIENSILIGQLAVDEIHINSLMNFNKSEYIDPDQELVHVFPVSYSIDENHDIIDPMGMVGNELFATLNVMTVKSSILKNIKNCLDKNNIDVLGFINSAYASALSVAIEDELNSGITVIDMGGSTTSIAYIKNKVPLHVQTISVGSQNITNDISLVLRTSKSNAERLKILYGVSSSNLSNDEEQILVSRLDEYGEEHIQNISKNVLDSIVTSRLDEILSIIENNIVNSGANKFLFQRIVITGGGSRLSGLNEFIKSKRYFTNITVRLGKPIGIFGSHDFVRTASFSTSAGAALFMLRDKNNQIGNQRNKNSLWNQILTWFKRGI